MRLVVGKCLRLAMVFCILIYLSGCNTALEETAVGSAESVALGSKLEPRKFRAGTKDDIISIARSFHFTQYSQDIDTPLQKRSPEYAPDKVLSKIHSWFADGNGLKKVIATQSYDYYELQPIPSQILAEIESITYPREFNSGFSFLQAETWREIAKLQEEGLHFGVLINTKFDEPLLGVYFSRSKLILLDIMAPVGTMAHELRHYRQFEGRRLKDRQPSSILSSSCIMAASKAFGELDAVLIELPFFEGAVRDWQILPASLDEVELLGVLHKLTLNNHYDSRFYYPEREMHKLSEADICPENLRNIGRRLADLLSKQKRLLWGPELGDLMSLRMRAFSIIGDSEWESESFDLKEKVDRTKVKFEKKFGELAKERQIEIPVILNDLDSEIRRDLCNSASGFILIGNCDRRE